MPARSDRGEATAQIVILTPLLLVLVFVGIQAAIWFHAANVSAAAAAQGASTGARLGADAASPAAQHTLADLGADGSVAVAPSPRSIEVTVTVHVLRLVPFFPAEVQRTAIEPVETFVGESQR